MGYCHQQKRRGQAARSNVQLVREVGRMHKEAAHRKVMPGDISQQLPVAVLDFDQIKQKPQHKNADEQELMKSELDKRPLHQIRLGGPKGCSPFWGCINSWSAPLIRCRLYAAPIYVGAHQRRVSHQHKRIP